MFSSFRVIKVLCLLMLLVAASATQSQASFGVMPMEVSLQAPRAGSRVTSDLEAYNGGDQPLHISASVMDFSLSRDGQYQFTPASDAPGSCAQWIQFNPSEFTLAPKKSIRVRYSISTPPDFSREHRAMIFFQSRHVPTKGTNNIELMVSTRVACKVFIAPAAGLARSGKIADMEMSAPDEAGLQKVRVAFENNGALTFRAQGKVEARDASGKIVATGELQPRHAQVLPGAQRDLWAKWDKPLPPGDYRIKALLDFGSKALVGGELKVKVAPAVAPSQDAAKNLVESR